MLIEDLTENHMDFDGASDGKFCGGFNLRLDGGFDERFDGRRI